MRHSLKPVLARVNRLAARVTRLPRCQQDEQR